MKGTQNFSDENNADFCVPRLEDLSGCQLALPESLPSAPTFEDSLLETDAGVKIPVRYSIPFHEFDDSKPQIMNSRILYVVFC